MAQVPDLHTQEYYSQDDINTEIRNQFGGRITEKKELEYLKVLLVGCDRFIDVGANIGQYLYFGSKYLSGAEIIAIEANPYLIPNLTQAVAKAERNWPHGNSYAVENVAILDTETTIEFFLTVDPTTSSIFDNAPNRGKISVKTKPMDAFYRPSQKTVIKMDIEGAEYRAIKSAEKFLRSDHTTFFMELHGWGDAELRKYPLHVAALFFGHGYAMRKIAGHYVFGKAPFGKRCMGFVANLPLLAIKWAVHRHMKGLVPSIRKVRDALQSAFQ